MKEELNLIESQILRIFRHNKKNTDDSMDTKKVLDDSLKALSDNFDTILNSLADKGYVLKSGDKLILTDKGDEYLYRAKLYNDY
jgi:predicted methyltransferase